MSPSSTRLLALAMLPVLLLGGETGLILGGILFQAASVLDGVDGEMARATFRTSPSGATLDSAVDIATNLLFVAGAHRPSRAARRRRDRLDRRLGGGRHRSSAGR